MQWQSVLYFLMWAGVFAVMMRFGCGAHVMGHHHRRTDPDEGGNREPTERVALPTAEQETDPVCGKVVRTAEAKSAVYGGHAYYFCSQACREKFEATPATYAKATRAVISSQENRHGAHC